MKEWIWINTELPKIGRPVFLLDYFQTDRIEIVWLTAFGKLTKMGVGLM